MADPVALTVQNVLAPFADVTAGLADFTFAAAWLDGNTFVCTGRELLLVQNSDAGVTTITVVSTDDEKGRAENITTYSMAAGDFVAFGVGLTNSKGWKSTSGTIRVTASDVDVKIAVLRLPAGFPGGS
jgi:hypothetical protein